MKKEKKADNLSLGCHHILRTLEKGKKIRIYEVLEKTYTCSKCSKNEPKNKKEFMDMFVTICDCCINSFK